jgi:hypothetical protein
MNKTLARIAMLALPALFTVGCGGDDLFGTLDMGNTGTCPSNTVLHRIMDGPYNTVSATISSDTCNNPPLVPADVMSTRTVQNNTATGTITVLGSNGGAIGSGAIRCNTGTLMADQVTTTAMNPCQWRSIRTSQMTVTADSSFTLVFTDQKSEFQSTTFGSCTKTACSTSFTVQMQHQ